MRETKQRPASLMELGPGKLPSVLCPKYPGLDGDWDDPSRSIQGTNLTGDPPLPSLSSSCHRGACEDAVFLPGLLLLTGADPHVERVERWNRANVAAKYQGTSHPGTGEVCQSTWVFPGRLRSIRPAVRTRGQRPPVRLYHGLEREEAGRDPVTKEGQKCTTSEGMNTTLEECRRPMSQIYMQHAPQDV